MGRAHWVKMDPMTEARSAEQNDQPGPDDSGHSGTVVVVGPDGRPIGTMQTDEGQARTRPAW